MKKNDLFIAVLSILFLFSCQDTKKESDRENQKLPLGKIKNMEVTKIGYGVTTGGIEVNSFTLKNANNIEIEILEFGAIVSRIKAPDKDGTIKDIVLGYDNLKEYENDPYYFGGTIGRVANRTGGARFTLEGISYELAPNTLPDFGKNHLHGGVIPFNKVVWKGSGFRHEEEVGVVLKYLSKDGEEGYPGNLSCKVTYSLNMKNELKIDYKATTDKTTVVNMTHHSYFNLKGAGQGDILDQQILINAEKYTPATDDLIPTGEIAEVDGLPVDFTTERTISSQFGDMQKAKFKGYDLNYVLKHTKQGDLALAAKAIDINSGRVMEVFTTQPCMHFYTSNFLEGKPGKEGNRYVQYGALCFEPQGYPDAANKPQFNSIVLKPGGEYTQTIIYKFSILNK